MKKLLLALLLLPLTAQLSFGQTSKDEMDAKDEMVKDWNHTINWFEIPVEDFARAQKFYSIILDMEIQAMTAKDMGMEGEFTMGFLGDASTGILTGAIMKSPMMSVAKEGGPTIYFNAHPDLSVMLARVEKAGGRIIMPKTKISDDIGYMAMFIDSEGNRLALHSIR